MPSLRYKCVTGASGRLLAGVTCQIVDFCAFESTCGMVVCGEPEESNLQSGVTLGVVAGCVPS